jgi:hypothetical protein
MEGGRVNEYEIVNGDWGTGDETEEAGVLARGSEACDVALSIDGPEPIGTEDFDVGGPFDYDSVSREWAMGS